MQLRLAGVTDVTVTPAEKKSVVGYLIENMPVNENITGFKGE